MKFLSDPGLRIIIFKIIVKTSILQITEHDNFRNIINITAKSLDDRENSYFYNDLNL